MKTRNNASSLVITLQRAHHTPKDKIWPGPNNRLTGGGGGAYGGGGGGGGGEEGWGGGGDRGGEGERGGCPKTLTHFHCSRKS